MAALNIGAGPFVRWSGAKSPYLHMLNQALPEEFATLTDVTYVEPFVGGGSMLFHMLQTYPNITRAVINDNNPDLMRAYRTVRDRPSELVQELKYMEKEFLSLSTEARVDYYESMQKQFDARLCDGLRHTALFIFINKVTTSSGRYHAPARPVICDERLLRADSRVLQRVEILCDDFEKTYNEAQGDTFFFLDPPCNAADCLASDWSDRQRIRLKKFCDLLDFRHFHWMLTGSDSRSTDGPVNSLYGNYDIRRIWTLKDMAACPERREKSGELLVRNFNREILSLRNLRCTQLSLAF